MVSFSYISCFMYFQMFVIYSLCLRIHQSKKDKFLVNPDPNLLYSKQKQAMFVFQNCFILLPACWNNDETTTQVLSSVYNESVDFSSGEKLHFFQRISQPHWREFVLLSSDKKLTAELVAFEQVESICLACFGLV